MTRSRTISGMLCLAAISSPLILAPWRIEQSLAFVHDIENRTPNAFPMIETPKNLIDAHWWARVSDAIEDRVPFRKEMISLDRAINPARSGDHITKKVELGVENWLFFRKSLNEDLGTLEETQQAIDSIESFVGTHSFKADLFILVAPNKVTIYPEKLVESSQEQYAASEPQRDLLHGWFAKGDKPYLIDLWTPMFALKDSSSELLYEPGGSHHNSLGAMLLAKSMIDAVDPSLWNDEEIETVWTRDETPDIAKFIGDWDRLDSNTRLQVRRKGVELVELTNKGKRIEDPDYLSIDEVSYYDRKHVINRSISEQLIPGKTLIVYDSFIGLYLFPTLGQFFEDVEFVHFGVIKPEEMRAALDAYDRVYLQSAERRFIPRAIEFFGTPEN